MEPSYVLDFIGATDGRPFYGVSFERTPRCKTLVFLFMAERKIKFGYSVFKIVLINIFVLAFLVVGGGFLIAKFNLYEHVGLFLLIIILLIAIDVCFLFWVEPRISKGEFQVTDNTLFVRWPDGGETFLDLNLVKVDFWYAIVMFRGVAQSVICYDLSQGEKRLNFYVSFWGRRKSGIAKGQAAGFYLPLNYNKLKEFHRIFSLE